jgi:hypothetical protein
MHSRLTDFLPTIAKSDELRRELEILSQTFERVLDRKEAVVQACLRDLNEAEQQVGSPISQVF